MLRSLLEKYTKEELLQFYADKLENDSADYFLCKDMLVDVLTRNEIEGGEAVPHNQTHWIEILVKKLKIAQEVIDGQTKQLEDLTVEIDSFRNGLADI